MSEVRLATSNMYKNLGETEVDRHIALVIAQADVVVWQECTRDHRGNLRKIGELGWATYFPVGLGGLAISWRTARFSVARFGRARGVVPGMRSVDPERGFCDIVLEDLEDGELWPVLDTHMTHQAWSSHPERRPRWWVQAYRLRRRSRRLARRYGRILGGGDVNRHRWTPKGTVGHWPLGGTIGAKNYDVLWHKGAAAIVGRPVEIRTPSDHDSVVATFRSL